MKRLSVTLFLLLFLPTCALASLINAYVRLNDPALLQSVGEFNNYLKQLGIFDRYNFEPFLNRHPMHATLYLAEYPKGREKDLIEAAKQFACHASPVQLEITGMSLTTSGNYVMLDVNNDTTPQNPPLQQLSDKATLLLSGLRDYNAPIPDWAKSIPVKRKAFERYGSPNVFFEFNPHLSLMAPVLNDEKARAFQEEIQTAINAWNFPHLTIEATTLGVGYTNQQGQITEEIAHFDLANCLH